jgi:hypothetical protein
MITDANQPGVPSPADGGPDGGPNGGPQAPPEPAPADAPAAGHQAHVAPCAAPLPAVGVSDPAALAGEPNAQTRSVWCRRCEADVVPIGKGRCPRCQTFLRQNFVARRHPVNKLRRDQLHDEIVTEYQPQTLELRDACRFLANVKERLETTRDGTPEHQRLMTLWAELSIQLRAAKPAVTAPSIEVDIEDLDAMEARIGQYIADIREQRARAQRLRDERATTPQPPATSPIVPSPIVEEQVTPAAPPTCAFCGDVLTRCAEIRAADLRWLGEHQQREDVKEFLAAQDLMRRALGWTDGTVRDPFR